MPWMVPLGWPLTVVLACATYAAGWLRGGLCEGVFCCRTAGMFVRARARGAEGAARSPRHHCMASPKQAVCKQALGAVTRLAQRMAPVGPWDRPTVPCQALARSNQVLGRIGTHQHQCWQKTMPTRQQKCGSACGRYTARTYCHMAHLATKRQGGVLGVPPAFGGSSGFLWHGAYAGKEGNAGRALLVALLVPRGA